MTSCPYERPGEVVIHEALLEVASTQGVVEAGQLAEAMLRGIASGIAWIAGQEAAYNVLQRHADTAALPLVREDTSG